MAPRPDITPDMKVGELLKQYPGLEETLIAQSPEFARLRNPVLRRTVGALATLRQVAQVGGVPLGALVGVLRRGAGLEEGRQAGADASADGRMARARPAWVRDPPDRGFDARDVIAQGGHPLERVMKDLGMLPAGETYALVTPFVPAPLVDAARRRGFDAWTESDEHGVVRTWFTRAD